MKLLLWTKLCVTSILISPMFGAIVTYNGNAYTSSGTPATSNVRASWGGTDGALAWDNVLVTGDTGLGVSECTTPCAPSYTTGTVSSNNVSGQTISGVKFEGFNTNAAGNNRLYVRPLPLPQPSSGPRNPEYRGLNGAGVYTQWRGGFATEPSVNGIPTLTITLPTGTRSVGFDYGSISNIATSDTTTGLTIMTTMANNASSNLGVGRYDVNQVAPNQTYLSSGPGFYGVTSTEDILTISIIANASSSQWILNIANFRVGVQINAPTPEPATFLAMGSALILISFLLRRRGKFARGGAA